jgi:beta-glucosidase
VVTAGSYIDISAIEPYADAIILAWYPGEQGGTALADFLFGKVSPAGRLPLTFYQSLNDLPPYESYDMKGRTYRYYNGKVQYPFGFGLSYTSFDYTWKQQAGKINSSKDTLYFSVTIKNTGAMDGDEVAQVYIKYPNAERMPIKELKSFKGCFGCSSVHELSRLCFCVQEPLVPPLLGRGGNQVAIYIVSAMTAF